MDTIEPAELTAEELALAKEIIKRQMPDVYTLKQLYGKANWEKITSKTSFGMLFKDAVLAGKLDSIELHSEKTSSNALRYIVNGG